IEKGTKAWTLVTVAEGWTSVVALSVASVSSAARLAVMAGEVTPCQVLAPEMVTMRARARAGLTTLLEVGMIEGSRAKGIAKPPPEPANESARCSSLLMGKPTTLFQKPRR